MLSEILMGCQVIHATGDADLLIVQTDLSTLELQELF